MKLGELVAGLGDKCVSGNLDREISSLVTNSQQVGPGSLFVCLKGLQFDGHDFIQQAIKAGAGALLVQEGIDLPEAPYPAIIKVPDSRKAVGLIAAKFYDFPSLKLTLIGITGTNGKTTTTYLTEAILKEANLKTSRISTISYKVGDKEEAAWQTTPEALELQIILAEAVKAGSSHLVIEVSSHGLALFRTLGCEFDLGVFTNLSQDHLDFHHTLDDYLEAKMMLFESLGQQAKKDFPKAAIINIDDPCSQRVISCLSVPMVSYGIKNQADIYASNIEMTPQGCTFFLGTPGCSFN
jgi:UDP-N-acetylmuramyl-tripeptide synthetase